MCIVRYIDRAVRVAVGDAAVVVAAAALGTIKVRVRLELCRVRSELGFDHTIRVRVVTLPVIGGCHAVVPWG